METKHKRKCTTFLEWMYYIKSDYYTTIETAWQANKNNH